MFLPAIKNKLRRRPGSALRFTVFANHRILFYGAIAFLLAFYAVALVHELIPGLCTEEEGPEYTCPFCKLVHSSSLLVLALLCVFCYVSTRLCIGGNAYPYFEPDRYPNFLLRAPPVI